MSNASNPAPGDTDPFSDPSDEAWSAAAWPTPLAVCEHRPDLYPGECPDCAAAHEDGDDPGSTGIVSQPTPEVARSPHFQLGYAEGLLREVVDRCNTGLDEELRERITGWLGRIEEARR